MIANIKFLFGVAAAATGMAMMIRYGFVDGGLQGRAAGLVNVCIGAWLIRGSFRH